MAKNIYSVSQVNSYIKNMFAQDYLMKNISVRGEVSGLKAHSSGHIYFNLKDEKALIPCVMFRSHAALLRFRMKEGMQVVANGEVGVYERDGKYQLYVRALEEEGKGNLAEEFERLKKRLEEMGLFAAEYKKPIPFYAKTIGVVTAPTGSVIHDIINVTTRRNPYVQLILCPAAVQGEGAKESIVRGIRQLEQYGVDVIIVGRGGGSIEDLWAFNEEEVAQAIFECTIPVISAVGHETDFTIADFVADLRAPTPSAAAELAVRDVHELEERMENFRRKLQYSIDAVHKNYVYRLDGYRNRLEKNSPRMQLDNMRERTMVLEEKFTQFLEWRLAQERMRYQRIWDRLYPMPDGWLKRQRMHYESLRERFLPTAGRILQNRRQQYGRIAERFRPDMDKVLQEKKTQYRILLERMKGRSPLERLSGGYAYLADEKKKAVTGVAQVKVGDIVHLRLRDGRIAAKVTEAKADQADVDRRRS
ncbi:MAG: exodeoxyribonuclease VII large subunit [Lachnospiraceae bacterium]|nr:exodeoxyribonuclease VII large subunit [Lachnospiraceae bacterium]